MNNLVTVQLTNGFGNNIFQHTAAKLVAHTKGVPIRCLPPHADYYAIPDLEALGIEFVEKDFFVRSDTLYMNDANYVEKFNRSKGYARVHLSGYFEDYRYYFNNLELIRDWYPSVESREDNALVLHMRTGDRLFMKNEFYSKPRVENYLRAIEKFDFDEFHIVTDMPKWDVVTAAELQNMKFHVDTPPENRVPIEESVAYFNELVEGFAQFHPHVETRTVGEDFNFIRKFKNILFEHGTLSWWAAVLSNAEKVGVYGPWRPWKGASNKNLSQIPLDGWFKWE
tara:strand:+ start:774 stop:1619 length:846 start_codon:yes stop_codon:yes gene_type:complete